MREIDDAGFRMTPINWAVRDEQSSFIIQHSDVKVRCSVLLREGFWTMEMQLATVEEHWTRNNDRLT